MHRSGTLINDGRLCAGSEWASRPTSGRVVGESAWGTGMVGEWAWQLTQAGI